MVKRHDHTIFVMDKEREYVRVEKDKAQVVLCESEKALAVTV